MVTVSVIVPTHNPRPATLERVGAALAAQTHPAGEWELIIVDNASTPPVSAGAFPLHSIAPRIVREERLGLSFAREAGIAAARGALIVFADDDNLLDSNYLANARHFFADHPAVGVAGGRILPEFEIPPAPWARPHLSLLALRDLGPATLISCNPIGSPPTYDYFAPFGAGMVIRTEVARRYVHAAASSPRRLVDRRGTDLGGCGDCELVHSALLGGSQCAYLPNLQVTHVIPAGRLAFDYLCRLNRQGQESWGTFCRLHFLRPAIPRWTVPLRQLKAFFSQRAWTRAGFIAWRGLCGYFAGLAN